MNMAPPRAKRAAGLAANCDVGPSGVEIAGLQNGEPPPEEHPVPLRCLYSLRADRVNSPRVLACQQRFLLCPAAKALNWQTSVAERLLLSRNAKGTGGTQVLQRQSRNAVVSLAGVSPFRRVIYDVAGNGTLISGVGARREVHS